MIEKETEDHNLGFDEKNMKTYKDAEALIHEYLHPLLFSKASFKLFETDFTMHFRDISLAIRELITRKDLRYEVTYRFRELRNSSGGMFSPNLLLLVNSMNLFRSYLFRNH